mmetsp:Transcript_16964/g.27457  ORF Transcript_16964/g.27457 Transcript_16964/m.27457 type:complete len:318 (-) Transcript_16964:45-998(-)
MGQCFVSKVAILPGDGGYLRLGDEEVKFGINKAKGRRDYMEDFITVGHDEEYVEDALFFGLFDGHGGSRVAEFCSSNMLEVFAARLTGAGCGNNVNRLHPQAFKKLITDVFIEVNRKSETLGPLLVRPVQSFMTPRKPEYLRTIDLMGTTASAVFLTPEYIHIAHVGDSRCILVRENQVAFATVDHRPDDDKERIVSAGGHVTNGRVNGSLAISRAIGDKSFNKDNCKPEDQVVLSIPEVESIKRDGKDQFIIMASDGIWDVMGSTAVANFVLREIIERKQNVVQCTVGLLNHCLNRLCSGDNCSLVIIDVRKNKTK